MNKYSPHEAFGNNPGLAGGGTPSVYRGRNHFMLSPEIWLYQVFSQVQGDGNTRKQRDFDTLVLHVKGAPRPRKGIIPPCSGVGP
jgi:hypothetical protein